MSSQVLEALRTTQNELQYLPETLDTKEDIGTMLWRGVFRIGCEARSATTSNGSGVSIQLRENPAMRFAPRFAAAANTFRAQVWVCWLWHSLSCLLEFSFAEMQSLHTQSLMRARQCATFCLQIAGLDSATVSGAEGPPGYLWSPKVTATIHSLLMDMQGAMLPTSGLLPIVASQTVVPSPAMAFL